MVEVAARQSTLASHAARNVVLAPLAPASRFVFRGREAAIVATGEVFGVPLPRVACRAGVSGERAVLWLGPDEWLLIGPEGDGPAIADSIERATKGRPHSLVDVSHRQLAISVAGGAASRVLSAGCPLDLGAESFPLGMCTRTVFGKAEIALWRTGTERFRVEVWRSFAAYVWQLLEQARRDWTV